MSRRIAIEGRSSIVAMLVLLIAGFVAATAYFFPLSRLRPVCCIAGDCRTITEPLSWEFQYEVSQWTFPRYVDGSRRTYVSHSTRTNLATDGVLQKFTAQTAAAIVRRTPTAERPERWPAGPMTRDHCCYVYRVALSDTAWASMPDARKKCRPNMGESPYWR